MLECRQTAELVFGFVLQANHAVVHVNSCELLRLMETRHLLKVLVEVVRVLAPLVELVQAAGFQLLDRLVCVGYALRAVVMASVFVGNSAAPISIVIMLVPRVKSALFHRMIEVGRRQLAEIRVQIREGLAL